MSQKFSDQPTMTTPAAEDLFPVVQVAAPATLKNITWANLVAAMQGAFAAVSTTVASIVRRATATEVTNGSNVDAFVAPSDLATEMAKRVPHSLATATNDVLVGATGGGSWVKKSLAELKTILGLGSAAYVDTGAAAGQVPLNSNLGSAAYVNTGVESGNLPLLDSNGRLPTARLGSGTADGTKVLYGNQTWAAPSGTPTGAVIAVASETVPSGFLECNGAAVSRSTYSALFTAIGVVHGYGDNSTTFNLPDYRGRFLRGWDHAVARDPDRASRTAMATGGQTGDHVGSVQAEASKAHTHSQGGPLMPQMEQYGYSAANGGNGGAAYTTGSTGGNETRPINAGVMFCIKY